LTDEEGRDKLR